MVIILVPYCVSIIRDIILPIIVSIPSVTTTTFNKNLVDGNGSIGSASIFTNV
jgi:hypothetical protein